MSDLHPDESACRSDDNCNAFKHWQDWLFLPFAPFIILYYMATGRL